MRRTFCKTNLAKRHKIFVNHTLHNLGQFMSIHFFLIINGYHEFLIMCDTCLENWKKNTSLVFICNKSYSIVWYCWWWIILFFTSQRWWITTRLNVVQGKNPNWMFLDISKYFWDKVQLTQIECKWSWNANEAGNMNRAFAIFTDVSAFKCVITMFWDFHWVIFDIPSNL